MMRFFATQDIHVQIASSFVGKTLEKLFRQTHPETLVTPQFEVCNRFPIPTRKDQKRSIAKIECNSALGQGLVHRHQRPTITPNSSFVTQRLPECLPETNPKILNQMMGVHRQIACCPNFQVTQ